MLYDVEEAVAHLRTADLQLSHLIDRVGDCTLTLRTLDSLFASLLRSIVYQQLSGKAAATIHGRVAARLGLTTPSAIRPQHILNATDETLRAAGLSRNKVAAIRDLATKTETGALPTLDELGALENQEIIERLTTVRGIGPWTVEMLLLFRLGRPDVFPITDLGVRKGYMLTFGSEALPSPKQMLPRAESWRPYRSVASWYLWRAVELPSSSEP